MNAHGIDHLKDFLENMKSLMRFQTQSCWCRFDQLCNSRWRKYQHDGEGC